MLQKLSQPSKIKKALKSLPLTLDATYDRMLLSIDDDLQDQALIALKWLAFSIRPLSIAELAEAVVVNPLADPPFNPQDRLFDPDDILGILPGLVTVSSPEKDLEKRRKISLAHFSVKEYLLSNRIRDGPSSKFSLVANDANFSITEICLSYQLQVINSPTISAHTLQKYPLLEYAARYWVQHAKTVDQESWNASLDDLCMRHLGSCGSCFVNWIRICNPDRDSWKEPNYKIKPQDIAPPLYYVASFGVLQAVELLLRDGADINAHGGYFGNALQAASYYSHDQIAQRLLESGANINAPGGYFGNALQAASYQGNDQIVQRFLENEANINAQGGYFGTALQAASYRGHGHIVQRLLENGADVNAQGGDFGTALQAASYRGDNQIVQRLLENGADVDAQGGYFGTALQAASHQGHDHIVQRLLENGADVNARGEEYGTALQTVSYRGHIQIVQRLLKNGADVNAQGGEHGTALQAASYGGRNQIVQRLLENGADVDAQGGYFGTALQAALYKGDDQIVQLLLKNGADVNIKGDDESTALHRAALTGNRVVMRLLLNKRPNVTAKDKSGEIPLHTAAKKGRKMVAWLLLHYCEEHGIAIHDEDMAVAAKLLTDSKSGIICDHCDSFVPNSDPHYHCVICYNDDFDLCQKCVDDGFHCPDKDHRLLKISLKMDD